MSHSNAQSGHIFKNSVGRKEKLRYIKHMAPTLCPPGQVLLVFQQGGPFSKLLIEVESRELLFKSK